MVLDLGLRDGRINYPKYQKNLTRGANIEAVILKAKVMDLNYFQVP